MEGRTDLPTEDLSSSVKLSSSKFLDPLLLAILHLNIKSNDNHISVCFQVRICYSKTSSAFSNQNTIKRYGKNNEAKRCKNKDKSAKLRYQTWNKTDRVTL